MQAGPTGNQTANSVMWLYRSTAEDNEQAHQNAGLYGPVIVTRKGFAGIDGKPTDVDREFVTVFFVSKLLSWLHMCCSRAAVMHLLHLMCHAWSSLSLDLQRQPTQCTLHQAYDHSTQWGT